MFRQSRIGNLTTSPDTNVTSFKTADDTSPRKWTLSLCIANEEHALLSDHHADFLEFINDYRIGIACSGYTLVLGLYVAKHTCATS